MVIFAYEKTGTSALSLPFKLHGHGTSKQEALQLMWARSAQENK